MGVSLLNTKHEELVDQLHLRLHYDPLHQNDQNSIATTHDRNGYSLTSYVFLNACSNILLDN